MVLHTQNKKISLKLEVTNREQYIYREKFKNSNQEIVFKPSCNYAMSSENNPALQIINFQHSQPESGILFFYMNCLKTLNI